MSRRKPSLLPAKLFVAARSAVLGLILTGVLAPIPGSAAPSGSASTSITEADWPEIRGARREGVSRQTGLMTAWGEDGPRELWRRDFGDGFSGVSAIGDRLVTMDATDGREAVHCLEAESGRTLWRTPLDETFENQFGNGPRTTPTIVGDRVVAVTSRMRLAVLSLADGSVQWERSLTDDFSAQVPRFGYGSSPLVWDDLLIVDVGGAGADRPGPSIYAFDLADGALRWAALEGRGEYASPVRADLGGVPQVLFVRGSGPQLVSLSREGQVLWQHPGPPGVIPMPVVVAPDQVFVASDSDAYGGHLLAVERRGDAFTVAEVWDNRRMRNHLSTSVLVDGYLYGFDNATFQCLDAATGERQWAVRGFGKGSLVAGGGLLYVLGDAGTLAVVRATPERYDELGRLQALHGKTWTAPTLAHGRLVLRDHDELVAYDVLQRNPADTVATAKSSAASSTNTGSPRSGTDSLDTVSDLDTVLARYAEARGGLERWRQVRGIALRGTYATFSNVAPFEETRWRDPAGGIGLFRLDLDMLGFPTVRAHDAEGPWTVYPLLGLTEPTRLDPEGDNTPYATMIRREAHFEPPLLDPETHGIQVEALGPGEIAGRPTLTLRLTYPDDSEETWHLDPETHLEVAIDATVHDFTLGPEPMARRTFYSQFDTLDGLIIPRHRELEFGSRLEIVTVEEIEIDPDRDPAGVAMPAVASNSEQSEN